MHTVKSHLSVVGLAQANDSAATITICVSHKTQPVVQRRQCALLGLTLLRSEIMPDQCAPPIEFGRRIHEHNVDFETDAVLALIGDDVHAGILVTKSQCRQILGDHES
jgi:hypothetical protein